MAREEESADDAASPVRRLIQAASISVVLTAPILLGMVFVVRGRASPHAVSEALAWVVGPTTGILTLPWALVSLIFAGSGDLPAWSAVVVAVAWGINASLALRRFQFGTLMVLAVLVAFTQCAVLAGGGVLPRAGNG